MMAKMIVTSAMLSMLSIVTSLGSVDSYTSDTRDTRAAGNRISSLHVSSDIDTGSIVKTFPHDLSGLSLLPSEDSDKFYLLSSGDLMLARPLDCEVGSNLSLALTHSLLNQTVLHLVDVHVHEAGDFLQFSQPQYQLSVRENQPPNTEVGLVSLSNVRNTNLELNLHPVRYRKMFRTFSSPRSNNTLDILLTTSRELDHEVDKKIMLRLVATDPVTHETSSARLEIKVINENDNAPVFTNKIYSLQAPVKTHRFSVIGSVSAKDADGDKIVYSLPKKNGPFIVVPQTGEILLTEEPQLKMYLLQVEARDRGVPPLKSKPALVYVSFEDDDEADDAVDSYNATEAHSRVKRRVTRAVRPTKRTEFTEADGEPEGKIVFQLEKESEHETFKIRDENPWVTVEPNGAVRVKKKWDYEELGREKTIDFWVIITNSGSGGE